MVDGRTRKKQKGAAEDYDILYYNMIGYYTMLYYIILYNVVVVILLMHSNGTTSKQ